MMQWKYLVLIMCLLSVVFLIWKEISRDNRSRLSWRLLASVVAVSCLYLLAVPLKTKTGADEQKGEAVILTNGFNKDSLTAFLKQRNAISVYPVKEYLVTKKPVKKLYVFGDGLEKSEWQQLKASSIEFHPSPIPFGIVGANWSKNVTNGSPLVIQGTFNNSSSQPVRMVLDGFGKALDSTELPPQKQTLFELKNNPLQRGKAVFTLRFLNGKDTVREPVPFAVIEPGRLRVLMLASAPGFENRFLANWLTDNGYAVVMRTAISKNRFQQSFLDTASINVNSITTSLLKGFDVLLADGPALETLTTNELNAISQQVAGNDMGLIVQADTLSDKRGFYQAAFSLAVANNHNKQSVVLQGPDKQLFSALPVEQPLYIKPAGGAQTIITDKNNNVFAAANLYGSGKILFNTLSGTYNWVLSGNQSDYARYWSSLIEIAVKKKTTTASYSINGLPFVNDAVNIHALSEDPPMSQSSGQFIAWRQNPVAFFRWDGYYWPLKAGWQNMDGFNWYAYDRSEWKNLQRQQLLHQSYAYLSSFKEQPVTGETNDEESDAIPPVLIWSIFIACCIFLWIEGKLF